MQMHDKIFEHVVKMMKDSERFRLKYIYIYIYINYKNNVYLKL